MFSGVTGAAYGGSARSDSDGAGAVVGGSAASDAAVVTTGDPTGSDGVGVGSLEEVSSDGVTVGGSEVGAVTPSGVANGLVGGGNVDDSSEDRSWSDLGRCS